MVHFGALVENRLTSLESVELVASDHKHRGQWRIIDWCAPVRSPGSERLWCPIYLRVPSIGRSPCLLVVPVYIKCGAVVAGIVGDVGSPVPCILVPQCHCRPAEKQIRAAELSPHVRAPKRHPPQPLSLLLETSRDAWR